MPYVSVENLPPAVQAHLPLHAQEIYLGAFNSAWTQTQIAVLRNAKRSLIASLGLREPPTGHDKILLTP